MTAILDSNSASDSDRRGGRGRPSRIAVRLTPADQDLYDDLEALSNEVSSSHIVVALLRRWRNNPELRETILQDAHEIAERRRADANDQRSRSMTASLAAKARGARSAQEDVP